MEKVPAYNPTMWLRFVERIDSGGTLRRVLQQKWVCIFAGHQDQWRDVPLVQE